MTATNDERPLPPRPSSILSALRFRDFRLLWSGLLVSNLGTWMQFTALGYYVSTLASTPHLAALYLGFLGAARAVPALIFSPIAGVVADTLPRRRVLIWANAAMSLAAMALAAGTHFGHVGIVGLIGISAFNTAAQSFDSPARQSWVPMLVDRAHVGNAIGLNSVAFNAPSVIGPAIAAVLVATVGVSGVFFLNAIFTLAVCIAVAFMAPAPATTTRREPMLAAFAFGLAFIVRHKILAWVMGALVVTALLVRPYSTLLPALVVNALHGNVGELAWAYAAAGIGGFGGALATAYLGSRERRGTIWLACGAAISAGVAILGAMPNVYVALPVIFVIGFATLTFMGATNTMIQMLSPAAVRGRAISVYTMIALGIVPGGALVVGSVASLIGLHAAFIAAGLLCTATFVYLAITQPIIRTV